MLAYAQRCTQFLNMVFLVCTLGIFFDMRGASRGQSTAAAESRQFNDPMGTSQKPVAPVDQKIPSFVHNTQSKPTPLVGDPRDFVAVMNQGGGVLTIWASEPSSWVWAHSAALYANFGDAYNWSLQSVSNGFVRFVNKLTRTCLSTYGTGVTHLPCDDKNSAQFFRILPMQNGAIALQSAATQLCLQTSIHKKTNYPILQGKCLNIPNSEQQWNIIPPFLQSSPMIYP